MTINYGDTVVTPIWFFDYLESHDHSDDRFHPSPYAAVMLTLEVAIYKPVQNTLCQGSKIFLMVISVIFIIFKTIHPMKLFKFRGILWTIYIFKQDTGLDISDSNARL